MRVNIRPHTQQVKGKIKTKLKKSPTYMTGFIKSLSNNNRSISEDTKWLYLNYILKFIEYMEEKHSYQLKELSDINQITLDDINDWRDDIEEYTHNEVRYASSKSTIATKVSAINRFYKYVSQNLVNSLNVNLATPVIQDKEIVTLTDNELDIIINNIKNGVGTSRAKTYQKKSIKRDIAIVSLLVGTGIRISPLVELNLSDLEMKNKKITVTSKGAKTSVHYFNDDIAKNINEYLEHRLEIKSNSEALFLSLQNKQMCVRTVEIMLDKYSVNIDKNVTPHTLRRTFGTKVYKKTGDIYLTQYLLGHGNVSTTIKHYVSMDEDKVKEAVKIKFI